MYLIKGENAEHLPYAETTCPVTSVLWNTAEQRVRTQPGSYHSVRVRVRVRVREGGSLHPREGTSALSPSLLTPALQMLLTSVVFLFSWLTTKLESANQRGGGDILRRQAH